MKNSLNEVPPCNQNYSSSFTGPAAVQSDSTRQNCKKMFKILASIQCKVIHGLPRAQSRDKILFSGRFSQSNKSNRIRVFKLLFLENCSQRIESNFLLVPSFNVRKHPSWVDCYCCYRFIFFTSNLNLFMANIPASWFMNERAEYSENRLCTIYPSYLCSRQIDGNGCAVRTMSLSFIAVRITLHSSIATKEYLQTILSKVTQAKLAVCAAWNENPKNLMGKNWERILQPNAVAQTFGS